jgi:pyruvate kinase
MVYTRAKIIATIGPATKNLQTIKNLILSGVNVFRINFSHGTSDEHLETILLVQQARDELCEPVAIMMDTKGYEIRVELPEKKEIMIHKDQVYRLGPDGDFKVRPIEVVSVIEEGMEILFDDGYLVGFCVGKEGKNALIKFKNERLLKNNKNVHIPKARLIIPDITEQDRNDIIFACKNGIDLIAVSFVTSSKNILAIKHLLLEEGVDDVGVIAKIETTKAIEDYDAIVKESDGIMVARGDLGIELKIETLPALQKELIQRAAAQGKLTIVATQMLESMIENPRPTRAEVTDVANAVFDFASAVMLSGETAVGKFPLETVEQMKRIIFDAEKHQDLFFNTNRPINLTQPEIHNAIAQGACSLSNTFKSSGLVVFSTTGRSVCSISAQRPHSRLYALTAFKRTFHRLAIQWGVTPVLGEYTSFNEGMQKISEIGLEKNWFQLGDLVVVTYGAPFNTAGTTNTIQLVSIGKVLLKGDTVNPGIAKGPLLHHTLAKPITAQKAKHKIVVFSDFDISCKSLLKHAAGAVLITKNPIHGVQTFIDAAKESNIPGLVCLGSETRELKEGLFVTLDAKNGVISS